MRGIALFCSVGGAFVLSASSFGGFTFTTFGPDQWGADDSVLGVSGYTIEDFEDVNLAAGLEYGIFSANGNLARTNTLPNVFKPSDDAFGNAFTLGGGGVWDGSHGLLNTRTNQTFQYTDTGNWGSVAFYFTPGARSVGLSFQQMDLTAQFFINGVNVGSTNNLTTFVLNGQRQGYLRIDATGGDVIDELLIVNGQTNFNDGFMIDHLAFDAVPEPMSLGLLGAGAVLALRRKRRS